jgi:cytochrome c oxidase subunit 2
MAREDFSFLGVVCFMNYRHRILKTFTLIAVLAMSQAVFSQTKDTEHRQAQDPKAADVHAQGTAGDSSAAFTQRYNHPVAISSFGGHLDWLFKYTSWVTFGFFLVMAGSIAYFIYAYRARPGHKAYYTHGLSKAEDLVGKSLDFAVFVSLDLVLIAFSYKDTRDILWNYPVGPDVARVQVMPQQWAWNFKYPGADDKFGTEDDINTINDLRVPVGKKVMFEIKSKDVIHGFFLPNIRMQVDAVPGVVTKLWFDTDRTGDFEIACYHHCGTSHYKMKAFLKVLEQGDYDAWVKENSEWAKAKYDAQDKLLHWGWAWGTNGVIADAKQEVQAR